MRPLLALTVIVAASHLASAQRLVIDSVRVVESDAGWTELQVDVRNDRVYTNAFRVTATSPRHGVLGSNEVRAGFEDGDRRTVTIPLDASHLPRPLSGTVTVSRRAGVTGGWVQQHSAPFFVPAAVPLKDMLRTTFPGVSPVQVPPPTARELRFTIRTGDDDLRNNSALWVQVLDRRRRPLTGSSSRDRFGNVLTRGWAVLKESERPGIRAATWRPQSEHEVTVRLNEPVALDSIGAIALRLVQGRDLSDGLQGECIGCTDDNWDMRFVEVSATFRRPGRAIGGSLEATTWSFSYGRRFAHQDPRPARFTKDYPVLRLTPTWDHTGSLRRTLHGEWLPRPDRLYDE